MGQNSFFDLEKTNVMVEFRIVGDNFDQEFINQRLSVFPSEYWRKGDIIESANRCWDYTCWTLSTGYEESMDVSIQLSKIIDKLYPNMDKLIELSKELNVSYIIDIVINIENNVKPGICFKSRDIEFAHTIGSEIGVDLYIYS